MNKEKKKTVSFFCYLMTKAKKKCIGNFFYFEVEGGGKSEMHFFTVTSIHFKTFLTQDRHQVRLGACPLLYFVYSLRFTKFH